jgi:hypothetical protein
MVGEHDNNLKLKYSNFEDDNETKATKVEIEDNYAICWK